jgi:hypothetical protein
MALTLPSTAGMVLDSITIGHAGGGVATRLAVYIGGTTASPVGATLLEDFGERNAPVENWSEFASAARPALPAGAVLWLAIRNESFAWAISKFNDNSTPGDWIGGHYRSVAMPNTLGTAYPATWPSDTGSLFSIAQSAYITYSVGGTPVNTAPTVTITSPAAGALTVPAGTKLVLEATATDAQDDDTTLTSSIAWSSSDPGDVPAGGWPAGGTLIIDTTGWTGGQRTITASVTDAGGLQATPDSFTLTIGAGSTLILEDDVQQEILQSGVAATVRVALRDATGAVLETNPLAPGDVKKSVDGGAAAVLAGDAGASAWTVVNGFLDVPLTAAEVTGSEITLFIEDQDGSAFLDRVVKVMVVGYDPRATPASTTQIAGAVGDALAARLAS